MSESPVSKTDPLCSVQARVVETNIVAVTVYPEQARVTRQGTVEVTEADTHLAIADLPATLLPQSVQAHQTGSATVVLEGLSVEIIAPALLDSTAEESLVQHVRDLEAQFRDAKDHLATLGIKRQFLESLADRTSRSFAHGLAQQQVSLPQIDAWLKFFDAQYQELTHAIAQQERLKQSLDHQLQEARQQLQLSQNQVPEPGYQVLIPLRVLKAGSLEIDITYGVSQASWQPLYHVRLDTTPDSLQLDYLAQVQQRTGETWDTVKLRLSTAAPDKSPTLPQPEAWYVNLPRQSAQIQNAKERLRSPILDDAYRMLGAVPGSEVPPPNVEVQHNSFSVSAATAVVTFIVPEPATILSDGKPHRVTVAQVPFASQLTYVALPQRCDAPYLQASLTNPADGFPLLPGTAHLFRAGGYVGQEQFDYVAPGQSFQLSLGLDERLSIRRELALRDNNTSDPCRDVWAYRLSLRNPLPHAVEMTVWEQVPVSRSDRIRISLVKAEPVTTLSQDGVCQWSLTLPPESLSHVNYQYEIEHPCDVPILGLDL